MKNWRDQEWATLNEGGGICSLFAGEAACVKTSMQAFFAGRWSRFGPPKCGLVALTAYLTLRGQRDLIGYVCKVTWLGTVKICTPQLS